MLGLKLNHVSKRSPRCSHHQMIRDMSNIFPHSQVLQLPLQWHHDERNGVSNNQPHHCLFNRLFRRTSKKASKLRVTGLCVGNSPLTGEFPAQRASNTENISIWWRHPVNLNRCANGWPYVAAHQKKDGYNSTDIFLLLHFDFLDITSLHILHMLQQLFCNDMC